MKLKYKAIMGPDDYTLNGLDGISSVFQVAPNEIVFTEYEQFVKDVSSFITNDIKLTKVSDDNQVDESTFEVSQEQNNEIRSYARSKQPAYSNKEFNMGYNMYAFNDELQDEYPIFLKFEYMLLDIMENINSSVSYNGFPRLVPAIKLTVYSGATIILSEMLYTGAITSPTSSFTGLFQSLKEDTSSFGFYTNNRIFLNILPKRRFFSNAPSSQTPTLSAYISFYLERTEGYIQFINFSYINKKSYNMVDNEKNSISTTSKFLSPLGMTSDVISSSNLILIPFSSIGIKISNKTFSSFKTFAINPITNIMYQNTNLLACYSDQILNSQSPVVDVKLDDGTISKYLIYNNKENILYTNNKNITVMFRM